VFPEYTFVNPEWFWLMLFIPALVVWYWMRYKSQFAELKVSSLKGITIAGNSIRSRIRPIMLVLRLLALALIITAMARPQTSLSEEKITTEGIDIVLAMDVSTSMLAKDFKPNRIEAAKKVAKKFIDGRKDDRIGLVVFAGESFTQCPITTDHTVLKNLLEEVKSGLIEDGTAIGMGLATAVNRLKESEAKSKLVILLTDGVNNSGFIDPMTAAEVAKQFDVRAYTIGVGTRGFAPYPVQTPFGPRTQQMEVKIDEELLKNIAQMSDGKYFRATDNKNLESIYKEIDQLEKSKIEITAFQRHSEKFLNFALLAGLFLLIEVFFRYTILRSVT